MRAGGFDWGDSSRAQSRASELWELEVTYRSRPDRSKHERRQELLRFPGIAKGWCRVGTIPRGGEMSRV